MSLNVRAESVVAGMSLGMLVLADGHLNILGYGIYAVFGMYLLLTWNIVRRSPQKWILYVAAPWRWVEVLWMSAHNPPDEVRNPSEDIFQLLTAVCWMITCTASTGSFISHIISGISVPTGIIIMGFWGVPIYICLLGWVLDQVIRRWREVAVSDVSDGFIALMALYIAVINPYRLFLVARALARRED
jgi:hypothetical protein